MSTPKRFRTKTQKHTQNKLIKNNIKMNPRIFLEKYNIFDFYTGQKKINKH